jgi:hypothetical protein
MTKTLWWGRACTFGYRKNASGPGGVEKELAGRNKDNQNLFKLLCGRARL